MYAIEHMKKRNQRVPSYDAMLPESLTPNPEASS